MPPSTIDVTGSSRIATIDNAPATSTFCRISRIRGTGIASRYRSDDHDASDAIVSPKNSEMTTISRKLAEKIIVTMAKLPAPFWARSMIDARVLLDRRRRRRRRSRTRPPG